MESYSDKGIPAPEEWFTGRVWINMTVKPEDGYNVNIAIVTFDPTARTKWHTHTSGQILFVTEGHGYYQERGKPIRLIMQGEVVKIPKNVEHWHGATHHHPMRHIAIISDYSNDTTTWLQAVTEEEYNAFVHPAYPVLQHLSAAAKENHDQLWAGYRSQTAITDPELKELFGNFAFDEVLQHDSMDLKTRLLAIMAATIGCLAVSEFRMFVHAALNNDITPVEIREVVYQAVPYVGLARAIDFLHAINDIFQQKKISLPLENRGVTTPETRFEKGLALQKAIFGTNIENMYKNSPKDLLHIQQFLSANCFGDYVTRKGLDIKTRELLTLSFLVGMGGTEAQIKGHIQGNANVGNDRKTLISLLTQLLPYVGYPRTLNAIACLNEVLPPAAKAAQ
ncbi:carboxymuconolactone decarboxylase family protein [Chitinophaga sp. Cy-1792]|uniref:(R)-mandelonitrile lyase n=1 Tax=Chitinophaga sp. Cy-1792 TaxID=2608339 RepID=UPI00141EFA5C|nr:carboxymuconolactone decarboxylase family protein [Chitinophaga sp. Cy-1792]NIG55621.1 cupin domain-containing protein [Chitinophaga sp. Cy-1792]